MKEDWSIALYIGLGMWTSRRCSSGGSCGCTKKACSSEAEILRHENQKLGSLTPVVVRISSPLAGEMECRIMASAELPRFQVGQSTWVSYNPEKPEGLGRPR